MQYYLVLLIIIKTMRKKDSNGSTQVSYNILHKITSECFERKNIDPPMITAFNNFIFNFADAFTKNNSAVATLEHLKLAVELINVFEANLSQDFGRHSCSIDDIVSLFTNLIVLAEKIEAAWKDQQKFIYSDIVNVFAFILEQKPQQPKLPPLDKKMQILNQVIQSHQIYVVDRSSVQFLIKGSFSFVSFSVDNKQQLKNMFACYLRHPNHSEHFKLLILRYLSQCVTSNHVAHFKKAIAIYQYFGSNYEQRRANLENQTLKLLQSNGNIFNFIVEINQLFSFSKMFTSQNTLKAMFKIIEKITEKPNANNHVAKILQEVSQFDLSELEYLPADKLDTKLDSFFLRVIDWVINISVKKENQDAENKEKALVQPEPNEEKIIQFVKKLSNKPEAAQENSELNNQLRKICNSFSKILKKLIKNSNFKLSLKNLTVDSFPFLKGDRITNGVIKSFIMDIVPTILLSFSLQFKDKSSLVYAVILRRAQIEAEQLGGNSLQIFQGYFKQTYFQLMCAESLNYNFMICFIFLKYIQQKGKVTQVIFNELFNDLKKGGTNKNNRNLIINMAFLLKILYPHTSFLPVKFKTRQLIKNIDNLSQKLDLNQILTVCSKQISIQKAIIKPNEQKCKQLYQLLNEQLNNYSRDNAGIFYSLAIGINDMIEKEEKYLQGTSQLLKEIKFLRKMMIVKEMYTLVRCFIQKVSYWQSQNIFEENKISAFLQICKILTQTKNKPLEPLEDLGALLQKLKKYLLAISQIIGPKLLEKLDHFKNNKNQYREEKYLQYIASKDFIRFYSQASQDQNATHILLMKNGLKLIRKIMQAKNIPLKDLQEEIKKLFLIYLFEESPSDFGFTEKHETNLKQQILLLLLEQRIKQKSDVGPILQKLQLGVVKELSLKQHVNNSINSFTIRYLFNIVDLCVHSLINAFTSFEQQDVLLFRFVISLVEDDKKGNCLCLAKSIRSQLQLQLDQIVPFILKRVELGFKLQENKRAQFLNDSFALYNLLGSSIGQQNLLTLVEDIIQLENYSECDQSAFLLKEIANIFSVVQQKSPNVCETIFNYIITLAQIFPGQQKLQIASFICNFFGLASNDKQGNLQGLEKNVLLQCNSQFNYKCLKCDDKRLICLGCSLTCHKEHPICFLSIPPQIKVARCQCREIPGCCNFLKENNGENRSKLKSQYPSQINHYSPSYMVGGSNFFDRIKYAPARPNPDDPTSVFSAQSRLDYSKFMEDQEIDRMQQDLMGSNKFYDSIMKDQYVPRVGSRIDRLFDRDQFPPGHAYRAHIDRNRAPAQNNPFLRQKQKQSLRQQPIEIIEPDFIDEIYEKDQLKMELQQPSEFEQNTAILKKYALLPKFIDLMINFCTKRATKDKNISNLELWSPNFTNPTLQKMMQVTMKVINPGSFHLQVRRQNPLNNVSCVLIKRNIAYNNRYAIIASGTDLLVFSKEKLFILAFQGKTQGFNHVHRHSISYQIHSVEFSPIDKSLFCASGLHNLAIFNISNDGGIGRTQNRYNVNNFYINKIKLTKMGIFVGVQKEIRVLNYTCKHTLTIKAQEANTLIRQWSIYEKAAGCQVYFVCPNGNIYFTDVLPSDQGKKDFIGRVNDQRKNKNSTGASVFVKDLPDIGKQLFASFKDGSNIIGHLQGDQMQNMTDIRLKGFKVDKNIFDTFFIVGHVDIVKLPNIDDVYLICTVKKYFPPQMSFHQGFLAAIKMKKDGNSEIQVLNDETTCQTFQVFYIGNKHFFILSLHTDGSLHLNSPTKIPRNVVEEEIKKGRQSQQNVAGNVNEAQPVAIDKIRKVIQKQIKLEQVQTKNLSSSFLFRQNADSLKLTIDYALIKLNQQQYELRQINFTKVITGFSLPHFGNVELPTRTLSKVFQVGFTNSQALYFFAQGSIRFKYIKNQLQKFTRQSINVTNNRMLQKIERIERLNEYSQEKLLNSNLISNFLNIKEDSNQEIIFVGRTFENFKTKINRFDQIFAIDSDQESSSIEKTALIIKMFLARSLKQGHACELNSILQLVNSIKSVVADANKKLFKLLKEIIVVGMKVYEKLSGKTLNVFTDQNYGLRAATESRLQYFYNLVKLDMGDEELNEFLDLLVQIIDEDLNLFSYYSAKYPGIIAQINRRLKRPDTEARAQSIIKIYSLAYPILDYCEIPCAWVLSSITQIVYAFIKNKSVRDSLYQGLRLSKYLVIDPALKSFGKHDNELQDLQLLKNVQQGLIEEQAPKDPVTQIYMMFSRGQIDQDAMFRMIQDATKILYEKSQEVNDKPAQQNQQMLAQQQRLMEENIQQVQYQFTLVYDLIDQCTDGFEGDLQMNLSRIATLYVISKVIDQHYQDLTGTLFDKICKMVADIDLKCQNEKLASVLSYSCLFNRIIISSKALKREGFKNNTGYRSIQIETNSKLSKIQFEKVHKIKNPVNLLPRIFKGQKPTAQAHVAYALTNLLIYPCEPSHVLLSLQCYWLLPNPRQTYSRQKCESSIRDGINSGNLIKVYQIAKQNAEIWQQSGQYLQFIQKWIEQKKPNWELALELLAIYYQN